MPDMKPRRGRPKGSGIDDSARLRSIAALIAAEPGLKPTTAIKRTGVNDPSIIRRLRDKFHAARAELMAELHGAAQPAVASRNNATNRVRPEVKGVRTEPQPQTPKSGTPAATSASAFESANARNAEHLGRPLAKQGEGGTRLKSSRMGEMPRQEPEAWIATMCGLGLQAISQALETQLMLLAQFVKLPQVALAMRQQVAINDLALALDASARSRPH